MELRELDFDVFVNEKKATHVHQVREIKIPAMSEFSIPVSFPVTFQDNDFFSDIGSILISGISGNALKIRLEGYILVKAWGLEKKNDFVYSYDYAVR